MHRALLSVLGFSLISPAFGNDYAFCGLLSRVAHAGKLREYSNTQIENGLCMVSKEMVTAVATKDELKQRLCMRAGEEVMREFSRRFPGRDPKMVVGRC